MSCFSSFSEIDLYPETAILGTYMKPAEKILNLSGKQISDGDHDKIYSLLKVTNGGLSSLTKKYERTQKTIKNAPFDSLFHGGAIGL
jgi:hypothetical protein